MIEDRTSGAIGIFDSGVGGLSIAKCITQSLPNEKLIYVADTLHAPYGEKSVDFIIERVNTIAMQLVKQNAKALVVACNTATVNAIDQLRDRLTIPIIGVEPAIKPAAMRSVTKKVAILVTQATSENQRFKSLIATHQKDVHVCIQPCPGLVEQVEQGLMSSAVCERLLRQYLEPLLVEDIDHIVLGCTHYPFLEKNIRTIIEQNKHTVHLVDTSSPVTKQLEKRLRQTNLIARKKTGEPHIFLSTKSCTKQEKLFSQLFQCDIKLGQLDH